MLTLQQQNILKYYGELIVTRLRNDILNKKVTKYGSVTASGQLAQSVRYEVDESGLRVYANDYIVYLIEGRRPGKFPPKQPIIDWIDDKGIQFDNIKKESLAFLIQRKISKEGTTAFQQGGTDLVSGVLTPALIKDIINAFRDDYIKTIRSDIVEALAA